jgi:hypothetical protein
MREIRETIAIMRRWPCEEGRMSDENRKPDDGTPLPPGVGFSYVDQEGRTIYHPDPFLRNLRWEGVTVDSSVFKELPFHEQLYQRAQAFLNAAIVLCEDAGEAGNDIRWPQGSVCYYCLHLATELFLKACILRVGPESVKLNHNVSDLRRDYGELLPGPRFDWPTPWFASAADLAECFGHEVLQGIDRTPDQLYRYGADKAGCTSAGVQCFTPGYLFNYMTHIEARWSEIWATVSTMDDIQEGEAPDGAPRRR